MPLEASEILFVGIGKSSILWYRCALPAMHLGADWVGVRGHPPNVQVLTGQVRGETKLPRYGDYRLVILQQPYGNTWLKQIRSLRAQGIKVLYEIDDYLHGVARQPGHDFAPHFDRRRLAQHELCMRICDGLIVSTPYLARRYAKFNRTVYICRNGIDLARFALTRPERDTINVGWAGATGHMAAIIPWLNEMLPVFREYPETCFVSVGDPRLAMSFDQLLDGHGMRGLGIPFVPFECYPAAMCMFDIALAPATATTWYRGKSDLRWLEASALGVATIADPLVYPEIVPGVTGLWAASPKGAAEALRDLLDDAEAQRMMGERAREHVISERSSEDAAAQWFEVCAAAVGEYESMHQLM